MQPHWTDLVKRLNPYVPGEQRSGEGIVKLNTNENPYPPSPAVMQAIENVDGDAVRRYPDPESDQLRDSLARYHGVKRQNVFVGNGSDEVLALAFMAYFTGGAKLQFPAIGYSFYPVYCDLFNIATAPVQLDDNFELDPRQFENNGGGIVMANPNAPTSIAIRAAQIETLLQRVPDTVVLIDEAYADFGAETVIDLIDRYSNLLVVRTYSKGRSLAGLRLGAAIGGENLIEGLLRVKNSFNSYPVDVLTQAAGIASIDDESYYKNCTAKIVAVREDTASALRQRGFTVLASSANFLFASPATISARELFGILNEQGILVRYWDKPLLDNWLRISIGTAEDMQKLIIAIDKTAA